MTTLLVFITFFLLIGSCESFLCPLCANTPPIRFGGSSTTSSHTPCCLPQRGLRLLRFTKAAGSEGYNENINSSGSTTWSVVGVTVSPQGFHVIFRPEEFPSNLNDDDDVAEQDLDQQKLRSYLPIAVTPPDKFQDSQAATSVESLTILQLLNGVDLAGPILPPDILGRLVVLYCYSNDSNTEASAADDPVSLLRQKVLTQVEQHLPNDLTYVSAHPWFRSKVPLPSVSLDRVQFSQSASTVSSNSDNASSLSFTLECRLIDDDGLKLRLPLTAELLNQVVSDLGLLSSTSMAAAFLSIALALRYKAPLVEQVETRSFQSSMILTKEELLQKFPLYRTKEKLQVSSDRVSQSIERGFQVFLLTRALELAQKRGDVLAAAKIRTKLDDYDRLDDLPTVPFQYGNAGQDEDESSSNKSWQERPLQ